MQTTPPSKEGPVNPHSGGSEGEPVQRTHVCPLQAGGNPGGHGQAIPAPTPASSAPYRFSSDTLMAAPRAHAQPALQMVPVVIAKQSEF
jgi:hypothetical protein